MAVVSATKVSDYEIELHTWQSALVQISEILKIIRNYWIVRNYLPQLKLAFIEEKLGGEIQFYED